MDINIINPYVRRAMRSVLESSISRRCILDFELIYVEDGVLRFIYLNKEYSFEKGSFLLIRPGVPHSFVIDRENPVNQPHLHFDLQYDRFSKDVYICYKDMADYTDKDRRMLRGNPLDMGEHTPCINIRNKEEFLKVFYSLIDTFGDSPLQTKALCARLLQWIIEDNFSDTVYDINKKTSIAKELKEYIDANCTQYLTLDILENQFHYSKFYLEKEFKALSGHSVMKYYSDKRLGKAKELLKDMSVTETAQALNFSSIYSFSRAYKNKFGVSPSTK